MPTRPSMSTARWRACFFDASRWWIRYASAIWSPILKYGCSEDSGSWKIMAILPPRSSRTRAGSAPTSSSPSSLISPVIRALVPWCRPMMPMLVTLLPEPDSPTMPSVLPRSRLNENAVHGLDQAVVGREVDAQVLDL